MLKPSPVEQSVGKRPDRFTVPPNPTPSIWGNRVCLLENVVHTHTDISSSPAYTSTALHMSSHTSHKEGSLVTHVHLEHLILHVAQRPSTDVMIAIYYFHCVDLRTRRRSKTLSPSM